MQDSVFRTRARHVLYASGTGIVVGRAPQLQMASGEIVSNSAYLYIEAGKDAMAGAAAPIDANVKISDGLPIIYLSEPFNPIAMARNFSAYTRILLPSSFHERPLETR
jgi:hypothetical protein